MRLVNRLKDNFRWLAKLATSQRLMEHEKKTFKKKVNRNLFAVSCLCLTHISHSCQLMLRRFIAFFSRQRQYGALWCCVITFTIKIHVINAMKNYLVIKAAVGCSDKKEKREEEGEGKHKHELYDSEKNPGHQKEKKTQSNNIKRSQLFVNELPCL